MSDETNPTSTPDTPTTTYSEYVAEVRNTLDQHPYWRQGQAAFNVLWNIRQDLANQVHTSKLDPFHRDDRLPEFYEWVEENW